MLSGCASLGSPPAVPVAALANPATQTQWLQAAGQAGTAVDEAELAEWWRRFDDPQLAQLVIEALKRNTDLQMARATLRAAQAARAATEAGSQPQATAQANASRNRSGGQTANNLQLSFSASWEPDWWGAQAAGLSAADADVAQAQADGAATRTALAAEVALAYVQWRDAQARAEIARDSLNSLAQTRQLTEWRRQSGLASGLDAEQAQLSLAQSQASLPALAAEIGLYLNQLALLTGSTPLALSARLMPEGAVPQAPAALAQLNVGVPTDLLRRRPDVRAAEAALQAQWARKEQTRRQGWPSLALSGSLGLQAATLSALSGGGSGVAALAAGISGSLWDGGQRQALVEQQDATLLACVAAYEGTVLSAVKDVEDALLALRSSQQREAALAQAAQSAERVLLLSRQQQASGLIDLRTLLTAERDTLTALTNLQSGRSDLSLNLIRLFKALGGGWTDGTTASL
ncbi:efflux transporter outer membrane subunit [Ideonella sp.]|uniref:efflux transporter outer membrane subunit n=1 Tax=Ideonella sp. TaxID=1929293 RepID=UPI003BB6DEBC